MTVLYSYLYFMKKLILIIPAFIMGLPILIAQTGDIDSGTMQGPYLGQDEPADHSLLFAPGFVSTEAGELNSAFTQDGKEFYFSRRGIPGKPSAIMVSKQVNERWTDPEPVEFTGNYSDIDLFLTPGSESMVFCSTRPHIAGGEEKADHDFWISKREGGSWSKPVLFAEEAISESEDYYPVITSSGNLYFNSQREGYGTNNIFCAKYQDGKYLPAEKLPEPVNSNAREFDAFVSEDEKMILFSSSRPGGFGGADIYVSYKDEEGRWSEPGNLGPEVNSPYSEYGAVISPDGKFLFFTSNRNGSEDIFWISASLIDQASPAGITHTDIKSPDEIFISHFREHWDDIHDVIMRYHYEDPWLKGVAMISMNWRQGSLASAEVVENTTGNPGFGTSLIDVMRSWTIPGLADGWSSTLPIRTAIKGSDDPEFDRSGILTGMVKDRDGSPVSGAMIRLISSEGIADSTYTNREGIFIQTLIPPGIYQVRCSRQGFVPLIIEKTVIPEGKHIRHDITLQTMPE